MKKILFATLALCLSLSACFKSQEPLKVAPVAEPKLMDSAPEGATEQEKIAFIASSTEKLTQKLLPGFAAGNKANTDIALQNATLMQRNVDPSAADAFRLAECLDKLASTSTALIVGEGLRGIATDPGKANQLLARNYMSAVEQYEKLIVFLGAAESRCNTAFKKLFAETSVELQPQFEVMKARLAFLQK